VNKLPGELIPLLHKEGNAPIKHSGNSFTRSKACVPGDTQWENDS